MASKAAKIWWRWRKVKMAKQQFRFDRGTEVKVKGRRGKHRVSYPMVIPIPSIIDGQFQLVNTVMLKFNADNKETFYAWEKDCSR
jgi:hypothetical protein